MSELPRIGAFDLLHPIGEGGMGVVWAARHRSSRSPVALKVITHGHAADPRYRAAFRNEVRAVARLDHPGVVPVYDYGEIPREDADPEHGLVAGSAWLVMAQLTGGSLGTIGPGLAWPALKAALIALLDALAHAHARGLVHRDLKPENALWESPGGRLMLTDFGLAHAVDWGAEPGSLQRAAVGTPDYMAPEQVRGDWRDIGPWTDLYALGCLTWALVTGAPPYQRGTPLATAVAHLRDPLPAFEPRRPVPEGLAGWLGRLLHKPLHGRPQRAADAARVLAELGHAPDGPSAVGAVEQLGTAPTEFDPVATSDTVVSPVHIASAPTLTGGSEVTDPLGFAATGPVSEDVSLPPMLTDGGVPPDWRGVESARARRLAGVGLGLYGLRAVPLVDRDGERDALWAALRGAARSRRARALVLAGPAGVGKSRLAAWLCERADELGAATVLRAQHGPVPGPGLGLTAMISAALGVRGCAPAAARARVRTILERFGRTTEAEVEVLANVAGAEMGEALRPRAVDAAIVRHLRRRCRRRPVIVWLDDVQFSARSVAFTEHLLSGSEPDLPVLVLLTARTEQLAERPTAAEALEQLTLRPAATRLEVDALPPSHHGALVQALLGLDDALARRVAARTAGNPAFATQIVGEWVARGLLRPGPHGFELDPIHAEAARALPADIREAWSRRIERFVAGRRSDDRALEIAACLGVEVVPEEWGAVAQAEGVLVGPTLADALQHEALAQPAGEGAGWRFVHGMLRETLVDRAAAAGRLERWHAACARILGARGADDGRVARHLLAAGQAAAALEPLRRAADAAINAGDYAEATALLSARAGALSADPSGRAEVESALLESALARFQGRISLARTRAEKALYAARAHSWPMLEAQGLKLCGQVCKEQGDFAQADSLLDKAATLGAAHGALAFATHAQEARVGALLRLSRFAEARALAEAAERAYEADDDAAGAGRCAMWLARLHTQTGRLVEARRHTEDARRLFAAAGARDGIALAANQLGDLVRQTGEHALAAEAYQQALEHWQAMASGNAVFARFNLGLVALETGRYDVARPLLEAAREHFARQAREASTDVARACLMPCDAAGRDWAGFDRRLGILEGRIRLGGAVEIDAARMLERAGELAAEVGQRERAAAVWRLAEHLFKALDRAADAARVARRIDLPAAGPS